MNERFRGLADASNLLAEEAVLIKSHRDRAWADQDYATLSKISAQQDVINRLNTKLADLASLAIKEAEPDAVKLDITARSEAVEDVISFAEGELLKLRSHASEAYRDRDNDNFEKYDFQADGIEELVKKIKHRLFHGRFLSRTLSK